MTLYQFLHLAVLLCNTSDFIAPCVDATIRCAESHRAVIGTSYLGTVKECFILKQNGDLNKKPSTVSTGK